jgi:hypothetical protein
MAYPPTAEGTRGDFLRRQLITRRKRGNVPLRRRNGAPLEGALAMAGEGSTRTTRRESGDGPLDALIEGTTDDRPPGSGRSVLARLRRSRLGLAALLPGLALAAVFVAEPFAGTQSVDEPTGPTTVITAPAHLGSGR